MIPAAALERGEWAFVSVLRRHYPDASFVLRDRAVSPDDAHVADKVGAGTAADLDPIQEARHNLAPLDRVEAPPKLGKSATGRNPRQAGR